MCIISVASSWDSWKLMSRAEEDLELISVIFHQCWNIVHTIQRSPNTEFFLLLLMKLICRNVKFPDGSHQKVYCEWSNSFFSSNGKVSESAPFEREIIVTGCASNAFYFKIHNYGSVCQFKIEPDILLFLCIVLINLSFHSSKSWRLGQAMVGMAPFWRWISEDLGFG